MSKITKSTRRAAPWGWHDIERLLRGRYPRGSIKFAQINRYVAELRESGIDCLGMSDDQIVKMASIGFDRYVAEYQPPPARRFLTDEDREYQEAYLRLPKRSNDFEITRLLDGRPISWAAFSLRPLSRGHDPQKPGEICKKGIDSNRDTTTNNRTIAECDPIPTPSNKRTRGQPRKWTSEAERKSAYRATKKQTVKATRERRS